MALIKKTNILLALLGATAAMCANQSMAQAPAAAPIAPAATAKPEVVRPAVLPGRGLAEHDFLYAGEAKTLDIYIVRGGKVTWEHHDKLARGEISDALMASNGNIVYGHQYGVKLINQARETLWSYPVDAGHEIHTAQFIGNDRVIFVQSGPRPRIMLANVKSNKIEREIPIIAGNLNKVHGQLRHARLTPTGTYLLAQMDLGRAAEYDENGKEIWTYAFPGIWSAVRFENGNTMLCGRTGIVELNAKGETVWTFGPADVPEYKSNSYQIATRLPNGNTIVNHWVNQWNTPAGKVDVATAPVQAIELTPAKKVVWALNSWSNPDLGPSTVIQILDQPEKREIARFGAIR
ncbi:MAG: hypothetical protein V4857_29235 [Pseudomonadota bacterium]